MRTVLLFVLASVFLGGGLMLARVGLRAVGALLVLCGFGSWQMSHDPTGLLLFGTVGVVLWRLGGRVRAR